MLHCSQEALGSEGKCLSAQELKNHSVHLRTGPSEEQSVKDLVVPCSLWAGSQQLARTLKAAVFGTPLSNMRRVDSEQASQSIHGAAENHPNSLLLEAEKYSRIGTSQKPPFDPINQSSWHLQSGNSSWYPAEDPQPHQFASSHLHSGKFFTAANHHLQAAAWTLWLVALKPPYPVFFSPYSQPNSLTKIFFISKLFDLLYYVFLFPLSQLSLLLA